MAHGIVCALPLLCILIEKKLKVIEFPREITFMFIVYEHIVPHSSADVVQPKVDHIVFSSPPSCTTLPMMVQMMVVEPTIMILKTDKE